MSIGDEITLALCIPLGQPPPPKGGVLELVGRRAVVAEVKTISTGEPFMPSYPFVPRPTHLLRCYFVE